MEYAILEQFALSRRARLVHSRDIKKCFSRQVVPFPRWVTYTHDKCVSFHRIIQDQRVSTALQPQPQNELVTPPFPEYTPIACSSFTWGVVDSNTFTSAILSEFEEAVHWKRNVFHVPTGRHGHMARNSSLSWCTGSEPWPKLPLMQ